jgi:hypothetical protein
MKLKCHICKFEIATIDDGIKIPVIGAMFGPADPIHNHIPPWSPVVTWEHIYCPMCSFRPFEEPTPTGGIIMTTDVGTIMVTADGFIMANGEGLVLVHDGVVLETPEVDADEAPATDTAADTDKAKDEPADALAVDAEPVVEPATAKTKVPVKKSK